jgi:hypothetical protein
VTAHRSDLTPPIIDKEIAHPARQTGVIGRRGASLDELEALYRSRFDVFARVAASVTGHSERVRDAVQEAFGTAVPDQLAVATPASGMTPIWVSNEAESK